MKEMRETVGKIGLTYTAFLAVAMGLQIVFLKLARSQFPELVAEKGALVTFFILILAVDLLGFPLIWFLTHSMPSANLPKKKIGLEKFILCIIMGAGICYVGTMLGNIFNTMIVLSGGITAGTGDISSILDNFMYSSDVFTRVLVIGIFQPVFEELVFRKILIDRVVKYGEFIAILMSGVMFGMFHGNFQQCFFTAGLGMLWAFVYIRTGQIGYTIALHAILNTTTSAISSVLVKRVIVFVGNVKVDELTEGRNISPEMISGAISVYALLFWLIFLGIVAIAGSVLFIINVQKTKLNTLPGEPPKGVIVKEVFTNPKMWVFYAGVILLFVYQYASAIISAKG